MEDGRRHCTASREPYFFTWHLRDTSRLYESSQYWSQNECWWDPCLNLYGVLTRLILVPHSSHLLPGMHSPPLQAYATGGPIWRLASTAATKDACRTFGVRSIPLSSKRRAYRVGVEWPTRSASESGGAGVGLIGISTPSGAGGGGTLHAGKVAIFMTWYAAPGTSQTVPATVARTCRIQGTTQEPAR